MKYNLYDENLKKKGVISFDENYSEISLRLSQKSNLLPELKSLINGFLKKKNLKMISREMSSRRHYKNKEYHRKPKGFDVFFKWHNPRTNKIELLPIRGKND